MYEYRKAVIHFSNGETITVSGIYVVALVLLYQGKHAFPETKLFQKHGVKNVQFFYDREYRRINDKIDAIPLTKREEDEIWDWFCNCNHPSDTENINRYFTLYSEANRVKEKLKEEARKNPIVKNLEEKEEEIEDNERVKIFMEIANSYGVKRSGK